jgi:hypothetical protein
MAQAAAPEEIVISGERIFPENLTSAADGSVIIGSTAARTIFLAKPGAATADAWIQPGTDGMQGIFGVLADDKSNTLWACSNFAGPAGATPPPPSALHAFDLKTGSPKGHYPLPTAGGFCNDIAIGSDGAAYVTDSNNMEVARLKKGAKELEVWAGNGAFGPKGGVVDGIAVVGQRVFVNTLLTSKLFKVPIESGGKAGAVAEVKLDRAIERPDGMRSFGKDSLLVTEGGGDGRLSRIALSGDAGKVTTIKEGYPDGPVGVTVVDTTAYVLEGQLRTMRAPVDPNAQARPFHATAVVLGKP